MQSRAFVPSVPLHKSPSKPISSSFTSNPSPLSVLTTTTRQRRSRSSNLSAPLTTSAAVTTISDDVSNSNPSPAEWLRANEASLKTPPDVLKIGYRPRQQPQSQRARPSSGYEQSKPINIPKRPGTTTNDENQDDILKPPTSTSTKPNFYNNISNINFNKPSSSKYLTSSLTSPPSSISSSPSSIHLSSSPSILSRSSLTSGIPKVSGSMTMISSTPPSYCPVGFDMKYAANELDNRINYLGPVARNKVIKAIDIAKTSNVSSTILAENMTIALIVADLQMDCSTVCASILRNVIDLNDSNQTFIEKQVGLDVIKILTYHKQLEESVNLCVDSSFTEMSFSNLRELILVRAYDEHRAILLELAKAILSIRTIDSLPNKETKYLVARRTMYLYAPLANQLGIWYVQSELEELAFMYLDPKSFELIRHLVGERRRECEDMLKESKQFLERILSQSNEIRNLIRTVHIKGRVKGLYSVYRKMKKTGKKVYQIYDLLALRVVIQPKKADDQAEIDACYAVKNAINQFYETFESRAKDYIADPKKNGYRSIHMTVLPEGASTPLEIQIRSEKMHHVAEFGAAAHWIYKESKTNGEEEDDDEDEEEYDVEEESNVAKMGNMEQEDSSNEFEFDSDLESIVSESDSESENGNDGENEDDFLFFNFEEENNGENNNQGNHKQSKSNSAESITTAADGSEKLSANSSKNVTVGVSCTNNNTINSGSSSGGRVMTKREINIIKRNVRHSVISTSRGKNLQRKGKARARTSPRNPYPRPRVPVPSNPVRNNVAQAQQKMEALELKRQSMRHGVQQNNELQHELRSGYVTCLASAIRASRVIVSTAGQLYGLAVGSTLMDLASRIGVATLGSAIAVVNGQIVPLTQRLNMNDIVQFITL